jgi:hypothetical protein
MPDTPDKRAKVIDYLPDQAGAVIMHLAGSAGGRYGRPFGPRTGMAILLAWVMAALACGYLVLAHTDVTSVGRPTSPLTRPTI